MGLVVHAIKLAESMTTESALLFLGDPARKRKNAYHSFYLSGAKVPILVDTFMKNPTNPKWGNPLNTKPSWDLLRQLQDLEVAPEEVEIIIHTHLHYDHCGNDDLFPNARIYVQREELGYAAKATDPSSRKMYKRDDILMFIGKFRKRLVLLDGDAEIVRGVRCVRVGAHSAGSQAVYVRTSKGTAILTGDTCFVYDNIEKNIPTGIFFRYDESISAIERFRKEGRYVIPSHDPRVTERHARVPK